MLQLIKQTTKKVDNWLINNQQTTQDEQQILRIQALQRVLICVSVMISLNTINLYGLGLYNRILLTPFYISFLLLLFVAIRKGFNFQLCVHLLLISTYIFLVWGVLAHTGVQSALVVWFHFLPFVAYAFQGQRNYVIAWSALSILTIFIIGRLQMAEIIGVYPLNWQNELRYSSRTQVSFVILSGIIILIYYHQVKRYKQKVDALTAMNLQQTKENLALKEKELTTLLSYIAQKNELLEKISQDLNQSKQQIENLTQTNGGSKEISQTQQIQAIRAYIQENRDFNNFWEQFVLLFNQIYPNFFKQLHTLHPALTQNEHRLCAYILMQISNKEIAALQNIQLASIEQAKIRLKKKLELKENEVTVYSYLVGLQ
jgi:DNA-binding CsgD family transcriptional regulator